MNTPTNDGQWPSGSVNVLSGISLPTLYSRRTDGGLQQWTVEVDGNKYRTVSGIQNGNLVTSEWTVCAGKNIGRANETTPEQQAQVEALAKWTKKKDAKYSETVENIESEAIFQPMLAKNYDDAKGLFDKDGKALQALYCQPKLDGIRCIATVKGLFSRNGKKFVSCPHIEEALAPYFKAHPDLILDGEFYSHSLSEDFNKICSCVKRLKPTAEDIEEAKQIQYHVYDMPSSTEEFGVRYLDLFNLIASMPVTNGRIQLVETNRADDKDELDAYYGHYIDEGFEGQMVRLNKPYENKRSATLLKRKEFQDGEYEITHVDEGVGNRSGMVGFVTIKLPNGNTQKSNVKGSHDFLRDMLVRKNDVIGKLATIRYFNITPDGALRFPYVIGIRDYE